MVWGRMIARTYGCLFSRFSRGEDMKREHAEAIQKALELRLLAEARHAANRRILSNKHGDCVKLSQEDTVLELMLPPLPGTNKAHPAFVVSSTGLSSWFFPLYGRNNESFQICACDMFSQVAAAAIAHYWYCHMEAQDTESDQHEFCCIQAARWSKIASGSREYDQCKIVAYEPRKEK